MLTVNCLGLSAQLRRSLACITPNPKHAGDSAFASVATGTEGENAAIALRWTAAGMAGGGKGTSSCCTLLRVYDQTET
jgi:hypothetical protein